MARESLRCPSAREEDPGVDDELGASLWRTLVLTVLDRGTEGLDDSAVLLAVCLLRLALMS